MAWVSVTADTMKKRRIFALQVLGEACLGEEALQAPHPCRIAGVIPADVLSNRSLAMSL
jgi:hypothetical protein